MKFAISTLQAEIENCRANEPIHRRSGDVDQADLCRAIAADCEAGLVVLQRVLDRAVSADVSHTKFGGIKPSHFVSRPMGSILQKSESETVAHNIMRIRARLGDLWSLSWPEYKTEREKDGSFSDAEKYYFDEVIPLISDCIGAISFAPAWASDAKRVNA